MKKITASTLFLLTTLIVPTVSHAQTPPPPPKLTVKLYQATIAQVDSATPPAAFTTLSSTGVSTCVNLAGTHGGRITITDLAGTAQACIVNGLTTDEVRVFRAKIAPSQAGTFVMEISTGTGALKAGPAGGAYSFAAALKNVSAFNSATPPQAKTANGILFRAKANGNDINTSGTISVTCGTTSAGTNTWTASSTCTKTESESLTLAANSNITFVSRYEFRTTAANDSFNFPSSGHSLISRVKDVDGGLIELFIDLGTETAVQYPFADNYTARFTSPLAGRISSTKSSLPIKADLLQATSFVSDQPLNCRSILSNDPAIEGDNKCSIAVNPLRTDPENPELPGTRLRWDEITVLNAMWTFVGGTNCGERTWQFMIELENLKRFFFDNKKGDCTTAPTFSEVDVTEVLLNEDELEITNWDLSQVGGVANDTYTNSLALVGEELVRRIAIQLDPHPEGSDQRVELSELVVNTTTYRPSTGVQFAPVPRRELLLQGVEFRVTKDEVGVPTCPTKILSQDLGEIRIVSDKYLADLNTASLCGVGKYFLNVHLNGDPIPVPSSTHFFLE